MDRDFIFHVGDIVIMKPNWPSYTSMMSAIFRENPKATVREVDKCGRVINVKDYKGDVRFVMNKEIEKIVGIEETKCIFI